MLKIEFEVHCLPNCNPCIRTYTNLVAIAEEYRTDNIKICVYSICKKDRRFNSYPTTIVSASTMIKNEKSNQWVVDGDGYDIRSQVTGFLSKAVIRNMLETLIKTCNEK